MKERPILFSAPMVRALLAGSKTQTRRLVSLLTADRIDNCPGFLEDLRHVSSPYGQPGDRLWVREAWAVPHRFDHLGPSNIPPDGACVHHAATEERGGLRWRPSIHMCRWASRITLEVTGVRVERLQAISEGDLAAEGIQELIDAGVDHDGTPHDTYRTLWENLNGAGSWDANPWVWVVEFKRIGSPA